MDVRKIAFLCFAFLTFAILGMVVSCMQVIYPVEADKKGATPSQYGFALGCFALAALFFTPLFGQFGHRIGPRLVVFVGGITAGASDVLFGTVEYVDQIFGFVALSAILQFIQGTAIAGCNTSVIAIIGDLYPNEAATLSSAIINVYQFGSTLGPTLGSLGYTYVGFGFIFYLLGGLYIILVLLLEFALSKIGNTCRQECNSVLNERTEGSAPLKTTEFFTNVFFMFPLLDYFFISFGNGMIQAMLTMHILKTTDSTEMDMGIAYFLQGICCIFSGFYPGTMADRMENPVLLSLSGNVIVLVVFFLVGPAPYLSIQPNLTLAFAALSGLGLAQGVIVTSSVARLHKAVKMLNFVSDVRTGMLLTGFWLAAHYLGNFLGSTLGGVAVEAVGFRSTTVPFQAVFLVAILCDIHEFFWTGFKARQDNHGIYEAVATQQVN